MADKLLELFTDWELHESDGHAILYQAFQAGFTKSAVSMRQRAMAAIPEKPELNDIRNAIGSLPDIPK